MLLLWDCFAVTKPLSQIQKSTLWPLQDANPTPSLGGFGLTLTVVAVASDVGLIDNFASTTAVETDPDLTNNSSTAQARVIRPPAVEMVKDIRPGNFASSRPADFADIDGILFFSADDFSTNGRELWKSDGTEEGTVFVKDIRPGGNDSSLGQITNVGGVAFFRANDGTLGAELWKSDGTATGTVLVKDIEPGISSGLPFTAYLTEFNDELFFIADDGVNGIELWKSDGTATGTFMVKDIDPSFSSVPTELTAIGDTLFFSANDGDTIGSELWKSDGTATGTVVVKNISPFDFFGSFPTNLVNVSGTLFFRANDNTSGIELWKSDGTATGTVLVKDISPGGAGSSPDDLTAAGDVLYFTADRGIEGRELWKSDGTATGTVLVKDVRPGVNSSLIGDMIGASSTVFFDADDGTNGRELWTSDGTASGTVIVLDIAQGAGAGSFPDELSYFNPLFFTAGDGFNGEELWMSDGGDTFQLADIRSGPFGSLTSEILPVFSNTLGLYQVFLDAYNGSNGEELWKVLINPLPIADLSLTKNASPTPVLPVDALTYTVTVTNNGPGSATGVQIVDTLPASVAFDSAVATQGSCGVAGSVVTCSVGILAAGQQATATITVFTSSSLGFITNTSTVIAVEDDPVPGNNAASVVVEVVAPPAIADISVTKSLVPPTFAVVGKSIGFGFTIENDGPGFAHNLTLTDVLPSGVTYDSFGASQGTCSEVGGTVTCDLGTLIKRDTATVVIHVIPNSVGQITNTGSVSADEADPDSGNNVSTIEERVLGEDPIQPIADIVPGTGHSFPFLFTPVGSDVFFVATDNTNGFELWKTDLTPGGTVLVKDINPGAPSGFPGWLADVGGTLFFAASDGVNGNELWKSDGTPAGTTMVKDIFPGVNDSFPSDLTDVGGTLFFVANNGTNGTELWKSDGTPGGTVMVKDIAPGGAHGLGGFGGDGLTEFSGMLFFTADDGGGDELWKSDGTPGGTVMVTDINPGGGSFPTNLIGINPLYFTANDGTNGTELWMSDGTAGGTVMVKDIDPALFGSGPQHLADVNGRLYFTASDGTNGRELWTTDGTLPGTVMIKDINPGAANAFPNFSFDPADITHVSGTEFYFRADDGSHGIELWKSDGTAANTFMVKDIFPGPADGFFTFVTGELTPVQDHLFFAAIDGVHGQELWLTDGTEEGTKMVQDLNPGPPPAGPSAGQVSALGVVPASTFCDSSSKDGQPQDLIQIAPGIIFAGCSQTTGNEIFSVPRDVIDSLINETVEGPALSITKTGIAGISGASGGDVPRTGSIFYEVTVKNIGTVAVTSVVMTDHLPTEAQGQPAVLTREGAPALLPATECSFTEDDVFECNIGTLNPGEEKEYSFTIDINTFAGNPLTNIAEAIGANASMVTTQVTNEAVSHADLVVTKTVSELGAFPPDEFEEDATATMTQNETWEYFFEVTNNGPDDAVNVVLTDTLPNKIRIVMFDLPDGCGEPATGSTLTCNLGTLAPGETKEGTIGFQVGEVPPLGGQGYTLDNTASATTDTPDFNSTNDQDTASGFAFPADESTYDVSRNSTFPNLNPPTLLPGFDGPLDTCGVTVPCGQDPFLGGLLDLPDGCGPVGCNDAGDPIYLNSGELYQYVEDLRIPGRGIDFVFARKYRSGVIYEGPLGNSWDHTYNRRLVLVTGQNSSTLPHATLPREPQPGDVLRMDGLGRPDMYQIQPDGSFLAPIGYYTRLETSTDGGYIEYDRRGGAAIYAPPTTSGLSVLVAKRDRNGNELRFTYDAQGRLDTVVDTLGRVIDYAYDGQDRLVQVTDFTGRSIEFEYDANNDLVEVTGPAVVGTATGNDFPQGTAVRYTYSSGFADAHLNHNLLTVTVPNEVAASTTPRLVLTYGTSQTTTDSLDRVVTQMLGGTNDSGVPAGGTYTYDYTILTTTSTTTPTNFPVSQTTVTDRNGNLTEYQFNRSGNVVRVREFTNRGLRPGEIDFYETMHEYNDDGQRTRTVFPEGNSVQYLYDDLNPDRFQQGNLLRVIRTPDADRGGDQSTIETSRTYEPIYNQVRTVTEARGNDPTYVPQNSGVTSAARYTTTYTYDYEESCDLAVIATTTGRAQTEVQQLLTAAGMCGAPLGDVNGDGTTAQVDGNRVRAQYPSVVLAAGSNQAAAEGDTTQEIVELFEYNPLGQVVRRVDPEGNVDLYDYHPANDPDGDGVQTPPNTTTLVGLEPAGYLARVIRDGAVAPLPDDVDKDGNVDTNDLQFVADRIGSANPRADLNRDGTVNVLDKLDSLVKTPRPPGAMGG